MVAEIGTFLMGGFETTAHTLSFTLFCVANYAEVQDKFAAELGALGLLSTQGKRVEDCSMTTCNNSLTWKLSLKNQCGCFQ